MRNLKFQECFQKMQEDSSRATDQYLTYYSCDCLFHAEFKYDYKYLNFGKESMNVICYLNTHLKSAQRWLSVSIVAWAQTSHSRVYMPNAASSF